MAGGTDAWKDNNKKYMRLIGAREITQKMEAWWEKKKKIKGMHLCVALQIQTNQAFLFNPNWFNQVEIQWI